MTSINVRRITQALISAITALIAVVPSPSLASVKSSSLVIVAKPTKVAVGGRLVLSGILRSAGTVLAGRTIMVSFRAAGTKAYVAAATAMTSSAGRFVVPVTAKKSGAWKAAFRGDAGHSAATSTVTVTVAASGLKLIGSFSGKPVVDPNDPQAASWAGPSLGTDEKYPYPSKNYTVKWMFNCPDKIARDWILDWVDYPNLKEIASVDQQASGAGTYIGHDGHEGTAEDFWQRDLKADIFGKNPTVCLTTVKVYSGTA